MGYACYLTTKEALCIFDKARESKVLVGDILSLFDESGMTVNRGMRSI